MQKDLIQTAKEIIEQNQYMTLASTDSTGNPWAAPVAYAYDDDFNIYWVSLPGSRHQLNIEKNPKIVIAVYDSHQPWGEGIGLQIEAVVEKVGIKSLPKITEIYFSRKYPYGSALGSFGKGLRDLLKGKIYHFYKAIPTRVWIPDPDSDVDSRIEVKLT